MNFTATSVGGGLIAGGSPEGSRGPKKWKAGLARPFAKNQGSYPNNCCNFPNRRLNSKVSEFLAFLGANFRRIVATFQRLANYDSSRILV